MMIACEDGSPYGPGTSTAEMFLESICSAVSRKYVGGISGEVRSSVEISIAVYRAKVRDYPLTNTEWESYDGVILPGSLSSAHEKGVEWIDQLKEIVNTELYGRQRRTLAVCFGHQIYAHALGEASESSERHVEGRATRCPAGFQAGRKSFRLTPGGVKFLVRRASLEACGGVEREKGGTPFPQLLYTHEDMVSSLPPCAISLGGNEDVPIQAAAYFPTVREAETFRSSSTDSAGGLICPTPKENPPFTSARPIAVSFQAHPEYRTPLGMRMFEGILKKVGEKGILPLGELEMAKEDAREEVKDGRIISRHSDDVMTVAGELLGWF